MAGCTFACLGNETAISMQSLNFFFFLVHSFSTAAACSFFFHSIAKTKIISDLRDLLSSEPFLSGLPFHDTSRHVPRLESLS